MYIHSCIFTYIYIYIYVGMYTCTCTCAYVNIHTDMCICVSVYVYIHVCLYKHMGVHTVRYERVQEVLNHRRMHCEKRHLGPHVGSVLWYKGLVRRRYSLVFFLRTCATHIHICEESCYHVYTCFKGSERLKAHASILRRRHIVCDK